MTAPNATLRAVRMGMLMSQDDFARAIRAAGQRAAIPNEANKRLVQRWEAGSIVSPRPLYARALEVVTGLPISSLGFTISVPSADAPRDGDRLTVRSLPGSSDSPLTMDLTVDGNVVTGTWVEQTAADGYYRGARYHGAIQLLAEPTGRRMSGKWVGFGKEMDVNTGPWELVFQDASTTKSTLDDYNRRP